MPRNAKQLINPVYGQMAWSFTFSSAAMRAVAITQQPRQNERQNMRVQKTEVLVAGAGPVGLMTAALLAESDIQVEIIDREERTTTRSYACALHPGTMRLLG